MNLRTPLLPILLVLLSALSLAACGNKGDLVHPPPPETEAADGWDEDVDAAEPDDDEADLDVDADAPWDDPGDGG